MSQPPSGTAPPAIPVRPPEIVTGLAASAAALSTAATSASDDGKNRRSARPRRRDSSVR